MDIDMLSKVGLDTANTARMNLVGENPAHFPEAPVAVRSESRLDIDLLGLSDLLKQGELNPARGSP